MPTPDDTSPKEGSVSFGQPDQPTSARIPSPSNVLFMMRVHPGGAVQILYQ